MCGGAAGGTCGGAAGGEGGGAHMTCGRAENAATPAGSPATRSKPDPGTVVFLLVVLLLWLVLLLLLSYLHCHHC